MFTRKQRPLLVKLLSLFSVVRGYNVLVIALAQYLTAIYILAPDIPVREVLLDGNLFALVAASALAIASGYIINNFYDAEKDLINRPRKSLLDRQVSQRFKLTTYFILNFLSVVFASYASFAAVMFFSAYIFGIWLYSHKLKRLAFVGNIISSLLAITPFFAIFIYYMNFDPVIFVHAGFLFMLILIREMVKDLENMKGDLVYSYETVPVLYGETTSKVIMSVLVILAVLPAWLLISEFEIGHMYYYFYACIAALMVFLGILWRSDSKGHYLLLHNILKLIIVTGVFSILLIDIDLVLHRFV